MAIEDEHEEQLSPLVGGDQNLIPRNGMVLLPISRLVGLCIGAMLVGAIVPSTIFKAEARNRNSFATIDPAGQLGDTIETHRDTAPPFDEAPNSYLSHTNTSRKSPRLAWLMSFPNSGTSYTLRLVTTASNMTQASNYGWEQHTHNRPKNESIELFPGGPFWLDPDYPKPKDVVLTKTHCGGYCTQCRARDNAETPHSFLMHCATSTSRAYETARNDTLRHVKHSYNYNKAVDRAVHLIRDPLDNMVSRYHLGIEMVAIDNNTELMKRYTQDMNGFKNYCDDNLRYEEEHSEGHIDQEILKIIEDVPCHMDLFRYVQWHNLAFIATDDFLSVPTLAVHYEDYTTNFNDTLDSLLTFLDLPNTGDIEDFSTGKSYRGYYTEKQISAMKEAAFRLASSTTWQHLERYF